MIKKLHHKEATISNKIQGVFQASYSVEAKLLNAIDFPPLKRPLESYIESKTTFFGCFKNKELAGVIEITHHNTTTHINSLVVHPIFFRQKMASQLMEFILKTFDSNRFTVETGLMNMPATKLYKKFNFKEVAQWDTDHGVRKIKFERIYKDYNKK